jgi:diguanylate cyclase (GGDEF)-like protein
MLGRSSREFRRGTPVVRYAVLVFLLIAALVGTVSWTLDRNGRRSNWQEHSTALNAGARVAASTFKTLRADLRVQASELATSLPLQRAVITNDRQALREIAATRHARIDLSNGRTIGTLAAKPRIASTATIGNGRAILARVTVSLPLGKDVLTVLREATPLPAEASLALMQDGRLLAGGPKGVTVEPRDGRLVLGDTDFAAQFAALGVADAYVVALEPVAAIDALSTGYRRLIILAALFTLALAAALATRLARPFAQIVGDVARLSRQANTDGLTGLANRRLLAERLDDELIRATRNETSVSLVMADIDNFKQINDSFGHQTGDEVLREFAAALNRSVRETDLAARYGGEEFVVVLPGARLVNAARAAEQMRKAAAEVEVRGRNGELARFTVSFGVAEFPTYANAEALIAAADAALYQAKRGGKNRVATSTVQGQDVAPETPARLVSLG